MMKKTIAFLILMALTIGVEAKEVNLQTAATKAVQLMESRIDGFNATVASVTPVEYEGRRAYYVVQFAPQGWALISADDTSAPLIGYSPTGDYPFENMPDNMKGHLDGLCKNIIDNLAEVQPHTGWKTVDGRSQKVQRRASSDKVAPLITVNWNQNGSYWKYCPATTSGQHAYVGCVAVGMAQAMSVAQWPDHATGKKEYDHKTFGWLSVNYDEEPAYNWADILSGANNKDDVARLLWHCGMSVTMDYGLDGSGAHTSTVANALKTYFKYPQSVIYYNRASYEAAGGDWQELLVRELQEGRAVVYAGNDPVKSYGHCFNLDGWDGSFFHLNWGWGGHGNAYFGLDGLKDAAMDMNYTAGHEAVIGVRAPSQYPMDIILSSTKVAATAPVGTVVADVIVESEATNPTYSFTLKGPVNPITHKATTPPFEVKNMQLVTTKDLSDKAGKTQTFSITAKNNENGHELTRDFTISVVSSSGIVSITAADAAETSFYTVDGRQLQTPQKGLNIVRQRSNDGSVTARKVMVK